MTGGLLQLVASGNQDIILTYKPEFTFFKKIYHRHTNFSKFTKEIKLKNQTSFGRENNVIIPKNGDLLDNIYIKIIVPSIECKYTRNKYEEYRKRLNDLSLKLINTYDFKIIEKILINVENIIQQKKYYYIILTDDLAEEKILQYDNNFYYINDITAQNNTYYIKQSELYEVILNNSMAPNDKIFYNFNYTDNVTYTKNLSISDLDITSSKIIYELYSNYVFCNNYHSFFTYLFYENINALNIKLNSPNIYLNSLYHYYKEKLTLDLEIKTFYLIDYITFKRGTLIDITLNKQVLSDIYIMKITKSSILEENIKVIFNLSTDEFSNLVIKNILKQKKIKITSSQDQEYNYNYYYEKLNSTLRIDLVSLSTLPAKNGFSGNDYTITSSTISSNEITLTLDTIVNLEIDFIIFGFIVTNTEKIIPDAYYRILSIDTTNIKIICEIPELELFDNTNVKLSDGENKLNIPLLQNILSDIYTNYLYIESINSNVLSSYSENEYNTYIRNLNRVIIENELQIIKNIINGFFNKTNYISRYYNIDQVLLNVDGSSFKTIINSETYTDFKNIFIKNTENGIYTNDDIIKYKLYNRLYNILSTFYSSESKIWDTYTTGSFKDSNYDFLKTRIEQITYLTSKKPSISISYSSINLSDGSTSSVVGDIYEIYPDDGSGSANTSGNPLCELSTTNKNTITSPITMTTLILQFNGEIDFNNIFIGNHLVKKNTTLSAVITDIYNSYIETSDISATVTKYRGFFYTNIFYNFYIMKIFQELVSSTIPIITIVFSGEFLVKKSDNSITTVKPVIGESYFLYSNVTVATTTKLDVLDTIYDGTNTTLKLCVNSDNEFNFQILTNFWLIDVKDTSIAIGAKITSVDTTKLINLNIKLSHISCKIYEIIDKYELDDIEALIKEATLTYYVDYSQLFNTTSIINEIFSNHTDFVSVSELRNYLNDKVIDDITYKIGDTLTDVEVTDLTKKYLLTTFLNQTTEYEFSIIRGMDDHINKYINIIDEIFDNEEEIGYFFYKYVNDSDVFNKDIIKQKIEAGIIKSSEIHQLSVTELSTYLDVVSILETEFNNNLSLYENNKTLLEVSKFDIDSNIFEDPNDTKTNITNLIISNSLITSTVDTTIYDDGLNDTFSTDNINNSLYTILNNITINYKYNKFMYLENLLTSFSQNKLFLKNLSDIKKINSYIIDNSSLNDANEYLKNNNHDEYVYFIKNNSNIYIPQKDNIDISNIFDYIFNLTTAEKSIEKDIYNLEATVRQKMLTYYTTGITSEFLTVELLEDYLTTNIGGVYKFKYGTILTATEYINQNYIDMIYYVNEVDIYGAIKSLYLLNLNGTIVNSLKFPFYIKDLWLTDEISQVSTVLSSSGYIITITSDCLPHPSKPGTFPNSNNSNYIYPQNFTRDIRLRVGENDDNPTSITVDDIGILANGIILYTVFGVTKIPNTDNTGTDTSEIGFNWNPVYFLSRFGSDDLGGNPDSNGIYHHYDSTFLKKWSYIGINNLYYYSTNYENDMFRHPNGHSKILGIMMDGYPLYGPYGYTTAIDNTSDIVRITTSYRYKIILDEGRSSETDYPKGSFTQDYEFVSDLGKLDEYNGRFCKTPEYPDGTYAYFITIDSDNNPEFPYILGSKFKSTPSTSSTYNPTDGVGTNYNILPEITSDITGLSNNESVFLGGGSGYQGKAEIKSEDNKVKLTITQSGYQYKKGDKIFLRKENIDSTLEYYDNKKLLLKRKSRFMHGFYYDYDIDKIKLISINSTDITQMENLLLEMNNLIANGSVTTATINTAIAVDIFNLIPIHLITLQLMTINNTTNNFIEDIKKVDIKQDINNLLYDNYFLDVFDIYIKKYKLDKFIYYYNSDISYTEYDDEEYRILLLDIGTYTKTTDDIIEIKEEIKNKIEIIQNNNTIMIKNLTLLENILTRPDKPKYAWISKLGNFIFDRINIYFNELIIDSHYSDWMNICYELNNTKNKIEGIDRLIGNLKELYTLNNSIKPQKTLYIPLRFWFCNIPGMNIPLIAMPYVDIKLSIKLSDINNLVRRDIGVDIVTNTELNASLLVNYIYLDENERKLFAESRHEYLIEQVQFNGYNNVYRDDLDINILLSFKNSVKDIFYILKKDTNIYIRDRCNYSISDDDYINGENPIEFTTFEFNGRERFKNYYGEYTNYIIPYEKYLSTPSDGINVISFSMNNREFQPSGTCNFGQIENPYLKLSIKSNFLEEGEGKVLVFARSYNILRIMSGLCGLAFVN